MINILYTGRNLRVRRRETVQNPPNNIIYTTQFPIDEMPPDHKLTWRVKVNYKEIILLKLVSILQIPNVRYISNAILKWVDLLHTPWQLIINNKKYVVEIDNVACLSFYKLSTLFWFLGKNVISYFLRRENCRKIICISEAAKHSMIQFFNDDKISQKCVVSYPFVSDKSLKIEDITVQIPPKLLYISSDFYLKWWKELLKAYIWVKKRNPNIALTIITKIDSIQDEDKKLLSNTDIQLVEANITKDVLYRDYYLTHDIFICPTYKDSFWLVFLEALSCGLAIITTDMFAVKEMVISGYNWQVITSPISVFTKNYLPDPKRRDVDIGEFAISHDNYFDSFRATLEKTIENIINDYQTILSYKKNSLQLYQEKFHNNIRIKHLERIYLDSLK